MREVMYSPDRRWYWDGVKWRPASVPSERRRRMPSRPVLLRLLAGIVFGGVGAGATVVGYHDVFVADAPLDRLFALPLLVVGGLSMVTAVGYVRRRTWTMRLAAVVAVAMAALATYVITGVPLRGATMTLRLVLITTALLAPVLFLAYDCRLLRADPLRMFTGLWPRAGVSLAVAGILVGIGQGWYTTSYLPTTTPIDLNMTVEMTKLAPSTVVDTTGGTSPRIGIQLVIHVRNVTNTRIVSIASVFHVVGTRLSRTSVSDSAWPQQTNDDLASGQAVAQPPSTRYGQAETATVVETGEMVQPFNWEYQPGEETVHTFVVFVPSDAFQLVTADASIYAAQSANLADDEIQPAQGLSPQQQSGEVHWVEQGVVITQSSWFQRLTAPRDGLAAEYVTSETTPHPLDGVYPQLIVAHWDGTAGSERKLTPADLNKFGIAMTYASTQLEL